MIQFYALSVFLTMLAGYAILSRDTADQGTALDGVRAFLRDPLVRLVLGIMDLSVGFFKLLAVMRGDIPVVGDLLPSAAGLASGLTLLLEYYREHSKVQTETVRKIEEHLLANRRVVGLASIAIGLVHFLFAQVIFL